MYNKSLTICEKINGHQCDTAIAQCVLALDFVNSALSDKLPLRFFLLSFCGLSRPVRFARSLHRRRVANRGTASDRRVIHLPRKVITPEKKRTSRREFPRNWRKKREEQRVFSPDFTNIIRTTGKSVSVG